MTKRAGADQAELSRPRSQRSARSKSIRKDARATFLLPDDTKEALSWIAAHKKVSLTQALRDAIRRERYFVEVAAKNGQVFVEIPGERMKEIIF